MIYGQIAQPPQESSQAGHQYVSASAKVIRESKSCRACKGCNKLKIFIHIHLICSGLSLQQKGGDCETDRDYSGQQQ